MARTISVERVNAHKRRVLEKASELFAEKGFHATTLEDIAKSMEMTKGSIYYYIRTKEDILYQLHEHVHHLIIAGAEPIVRSNDTPDVKLRKIIVSHLGVGLSETSGCAVLALARTRVALTGQLKAKIVRKRDKYEKMLRRVLEEGIEQGVFLRCNVPLAVRYVLGTLNYAAEWYNSRGPLSKDDVARFFADMTMSALMTDRSQASESLEATAEQLAAPLAVP